MNDESRAADLIQKYLDGMLSESELAELQQLLIGDTTIADTFYAAARDDENLRDYFRRRRDNARMATILDDVMASPASNRACQTSDETAATQPPNSSKPECGSNSVRPASRRKRRLLRLTTWQWCAAASLLFAAGTGFYFAFVGDHRSPSAISHEVVTGSVRVNGAEATRVPEGATFEVVGQVAAVIQLTDGSRAELAPGTSATIRGRVGQVRQVIALNRGSGRFEIKKGDGQFRVETAVGGVTALGTEFTVSVLSDETTTRDAAAPEAALVVGVIAGNVEVDYADEIYPLALGDDRIYFVARTAPTSESAHVGKVIAVSEDLHSITLETERAGDPLRRPVTVRLSNETHFSWVNIPADHQIPSLGYRASVWLNDNRDAGAASFVRFSVEKRSGLPASVTGHVAHVADGGRSITLQMPRAPQSKEPPVTRLVTIDAGTKVEYSFVRFDGELPTAGYNAIVWFRPNSTDVASAVHFAGDKRGHYRPDLCGRIVGVTDHGGKVEIEHPKSESVFHPGRTVTRTTLGIGSHTKLLYHDLPPAEHKPLIGQYAEIWMQHDVPHHVEAVRFSRTKTTAGNWP